MKLVPRILLLTGFAALCGCQSWRLPEGTPPAGAIVIPTLHTEFDEPAAENTLITALAAASTDIVIPREIAIDATDPKWNAMAHRILRETGKISGICYLANAKVELRLRQEANELLADLYRPSDKTVLWQQKVVLKIKNPQSNNKSTTTRVM